MYLAIAVTFSVTFPAVLVAASPTPSADGASAARGNLAAYLSSHDVASESELRAILRAPEGELMAIASDEKSEALVRARAVAALRLVATPEVRRFLGKLIEDKAKSSLPDERLILRRAAVTLGWLGGTGTPERLALLFENEDVEVRVDAAVGIALTRSAVAAKFLRRQHAMESVPRVRDTIERQLRSLGESLDEKKQPEPPKSQQPMRGGF